MNIVLGWGLDVVRAFQGIANPALTLIAQALSALGTQWFYFALLPFVYWCMDRRKGSRILLLFLISAFLNTGLKELLAQPRPYDLDPGVAFSHESSHGLPSGHAQQAALIWGALAPMIGGGIGLTLAIALPLLIGLSRIYLGVHFPTDVIAGWVLGYMLLGLNNLAGDSVTKALKMLPSTLRLAVVALVAVVITALLQADSILAGGVAGVGAGLVYASEKAPFAAAGSIPKRVMRWLLGMFVLAGLFVGLNILFSPIEVGHEKLFGFIKYAAVGLWISFFAPWFFIKMGLDEAVVKAEKVEQV